MPMMYWSISELNETDLALIEEFKSRFPLEIPGDFDSLVITEHLHEGELDHVMDKTWNEALESREQSLYGCDLALMRPKGQMYYLPAYFLCTLRSPDNDLIDDLSEFILKNVDITRTELSPDQLSLICQVMKGWAKMEVDRKLVAKATRVVCSMTSS